jgi:hypothetical protein
MWQACGKRCYLDGYRFVFCTFVLIIGITFFGSAPFELHSVALRCPPSNSLATSSIRYFPTSVCHCLDGPILNNRIIYLNQLLPSVQAAPYRSKLATLLNSSPAISCMCSTQTRALLIPFTPAQPSLLSRFE